MLHILSMLDDDSLVLVSGGTSDDVMDGGSGDDMMGGGGGGDDVMGGGGGGDDVMGGGGSGDDTMAAGSDDVMGSGGSGADDTSQGEGESWSPDETAGARGHEPSGGDDQDAIDRRFAERDDAIGAAQREIQRDLPFASQAQSRILAESHVRDQGQFADLEGKRATQYWENSTPGGDPSDPSALYRFRGGYREAQPGFSRPSYPFGAPGPRLAR